MEIKYTLEILAKDIQDIGKLVENLHNSPDGSTLELDLALSKLRNVYDVLNEIRTDISIQRKSEALAKASEPKVEAQPESPEPEPEHVNTPHPEHVNTPHPEPGQMPLQEPLREPEPEQKHPEKNSPGIIAEKFAAESSINENMAGNRDQGVEAKLLGPPIDDIGRNIGINDRFLIIRELFDGDSDGFGKLIRDLDGAAGLQDANERLRMQFKKSPDHEGVTILSTLVKRRFSAT